MAIMLEMEQVTLLVLKIITVVTQKNTARSVHFFSLIDLATGMYVGCGTSRLSEWDAFNKAVAMLRRVGVAVRSMRFYRYFSSRKVIKMFDRSVSLFLVPKKNIARIGFWADILAKMMASPVDFLSEYFHRNVCESGFSADNGRFGRIISGKGKIDNRLRSSQTHFPQSLCNKN